MNLKFLKFGKKRKGSLAENLADNFNGDIKIDNNEKKLSKGDLEEIEKKRKTMLGSEFKGNFITKEELNKIISEHLVMQKTTGNNPFKTREDCFVTFVNEKWQRRFTLPFEEINYGDKKLIMNKTFEDGLIKINYLFFLPETSIDIKDAVVNLNSNIKNLDRLNSWINYVEAQRTRGNEKYRLWDLKNDILKKIQLETKIETVKYGESATYETDIFGKFGYIIQKNNNNYTWLKITNNGYLTTEPSSKSTVHKTILDKTDSVLNIRNKAKGFTLLQGILFLIFFIVGAVTFYQFASFDEQLLDKRVEETVNLRLEGYQQQINFLTNELRRINPNYQINPNTDNQTIPDFNVPR